MARHLAGCGGGRQAAMQSRRLWLTEIIGVESVPALAGEPGGLGVTRGRSASLSLPTVLVGPEGGWSPIEEETAQLRSSWDRCSAHRVGCGGAGVLLVALGLDWSGPWWGRSQVASGATP